MSETERRQTKYLVYNKEVKDAFNLRTGSDIAQTANSLGYQTVRKGVRPKDTKNWLDKKKYHHIAADILDDGDFPCLDKEKNDWISSAVKLCDMVRNNLIAGDDHTSILGLMGEYGIIAPFTNLEAGPVIEKMLKRGMRTADRTTDFIDQVWLPHVLELEPEHYKRLLIDELQDTGIAAMDLYLKSGKEGIITGVGDPWQAIYRWLGVPMDGMDRFQKRTEADVLPNNKCFRCPTSSIEIAKNYCPEIEAADGAKEGKVITLNQKEIYKDFSWREGDLFLCRTNEPLVRMGLELMRMGIPIYMRNRGFESDLDEVVNKVEKACDGKHDTFCNSLEVLRRQTLELYARNKTSDSAVQAFSDKCDAVYALYVHVWEQGGRSILDIKRKIKDMFQSGGKRVTLSSVHSAKGSEAPRVFLVQPGKSSRGKNPHPDEIQQERNLNYIATTRVTQAAEGYLFYLVNKKGSVGEF